MHKLDDPSLFRSVPYIDGAWLAEGAQTTRELRNPSTGDHLADIPQLSAAQARAAIEAAHAALPAWRRRSGKERGAILRRWFDLIVANADDLARLMVMEEGKPLAEAKGEVAYAASFVEWFAEEAKRVKGDVMLAPERSRRILTLKEPVGVCAAITPWILSGGDDHPQGSPRPRGRLYHGRQASRADAPHGVRAGRPRGACRRSRGRVERDYR